MSGILSDSQPGNVLARRHFMKISAAVGAGMILGPAGALATVDISAARAREVRFLGRADAPVKVAEYFSMTCGHCGNFHRNTFPQVEENLIDKGLIRFEMHPFPLDQLALQAHAICRVLPEASYFRMVDVLLNQQEKWVRSEQAVSVLMQYAKLAGISAADYDAIMSNRPYLEAIVEIRQDALRRFNIQSTPSFVINDEKTFSGALSYDDFVAELNAFGI